MKQRILLLIGLLFTLGVSSFGQTKLTLKECIDLALRYNPEARSATIQTQISQLDLRSAKYAMLPTLGVGVNHGYNFGRSIDRFTNQFVTRSILSDYFSLNANWTLYNGFQTRNTIRFEKLNLLASQKDLDAFKNQLSMNVASSYLSLLMSKELVKSLESQVEATQIQLDRAKKLTLSGAVDKSNELGLESQLANEMLSLVEAKNQFEIAKITLQNLILMPPTETWDIEEPRVNMSQEFPVYIAEQVYENAVKTMPEIQSSQLRLQGSEMLEKINSGMRGPTISLYANMSTVFSENALQITNVVPTGATREIGYVGGTNQIVYEPIFRADTRVIPFGEQLRSNFGQTLGVSLSWTIFNGFTVNNNIKRSRFNSEIQQNNLQLAQNTLKANITRSVADLNASKAKIVASEKALDAAKMQMDFAEKRFTGGLISIFDYNNSKNQLTRAEISMVQSRYELLFNLMIVEFYNGNTIQLPGL